MRMFALRSPPPLMFVAILSFAASPAAADVLGGLEFNLGLGGTYETDPDKGPKAEDDMAPTLGITPIIEKKLGESVAIGGEWMFLWFRSDADPDDADRRLVMSPHLRARMSFPIVNDVTFDGMLGIGPTIWTSHEVEFENAAGEKDSRKDGTRFGWSLRFAFGASYAINERVSTYLNFGYYTGTTYGDSRTDDLYMLPLSLGLRSNF